MATLSPEAKKARQEHDRFLVMLNAAVMWPEKWDAGNIIGQYWASAFPSLDIQEEDFNEKLIDRIRKQLLINAGVPNPILSESTLTKRIKENITF
jgi:hypothetical protein